MLRAWLKTRNKREAWAKMRSQWQSCYPSKVYAREISGLPRSGWHHVSSACSGRLFCSEIQCFLGKYYLILNQMTPNLFFYSSLCTNSCNLWSRCSIASTEVAATTKLQQPRNLYDHYKFTLFPLPVAYSDFSNNTKQSLSCINCQGLYIHVTVSQVLFSILNSFSLHWSILKVLSSMHSWALSTSTPWGKGCRTTLSRKIVCFLLAQVPVAWLCDSPRDGPR